MLQLLAIAIAVGASEWEEVDRDDGIVIEAREVKGSDHRELRATTTAKLPVEALCDSAFGPTKFDAEEPGLKSRRILSSSADEVLHYDQMATPVVTDRDVVLRDRRVREGAVCKVFVDAVTDPKVPVREDHVRLDGLRVSWVFEPKPDGTTAITHVVWTDPKVSMPRAFVEPSRRQNLITWVQLVLKRASRRAAGGPAPSR